MVNEAVARITYHDRLRRARLSAGLDQRALAQAIGCSPSTISATETGKHELGSTRLILWAVACGVSLDWIGGQSGE